ncbi:MAG: hypothetical protein IKP96_01580 [Elusimicrobiaceae bacterium]|nr:hypothetical protein [Elusimicrobiaceae bacterium]
MTHKLKNFLKICQIPVMTCLVVLLVSSSPAFAQKPWGNVGRKIRRVVSSFPSRVLGPRLLEVNSVAVPVVQKLPVVLGTNQTEQQILGIGRLYREYQLPGAIFRAYAPSMLHSYSGAIFKTVYNGQEEIYGVVASHTLAPFPIDELSELWKYQGLWKTFNLVIYDQNGRLIKLPAEMVQLGAPGMVDAVLVKFRQEDEAKLSPLELDLTGISFGDRLFTQGFVQDELITIAGQQLMRKTPMASQITISGNADARKGLCGGPVMKENHRGKLKLAGIHVGSQLSKDDQMTDIGYVIEAKYLQLLVESYHTEGKTTFPLIFNGRTLLNLHLNEYISGMVLFDEKRNIIWEDTDIHFFSYRKLMKLIMQFSPRYIGFEIGATERIPGKDQFIYFSSKERQVMYDVREDRILDAPPW